MSAANKERRLGYVVSFRRNGHPVRGSLLRFHEHNGTRRDTWTPAFNSMSLFDIGHVQSVSYLTPFAPEPRLSLTGDPFEGAVQA